MKNFLAIISAQCIISVLLFPPAVLRAATPLIPPNEHVSLGSYSHIPALELSATDLSAESLTHLPIIDTADFTSIEAAISAAGKKESILRISKQLPIKSNLSVPEHIHLQFHEGGILTINPWVSVTIKGTLQAGLFQIFAGSGSVDITSDALSKVYPQWWGAKGDGVTNDTQAVQQSINTIARAKKGNVVFVKGTYLVDTIVLNSNVTITGQGWNSIIKHNKYGYRFCFSINPNSEGTPNPKDNKHDITITNIQFRGSVDEDGFAEGIHLLNINAATNVVISKCSFVGWRGDAIYLGSSNVAKTERHNRNITISECSFDGLNNDNRNAISIIDGNEVVITKSSFTNCTRGNMPGAIDLEPDIENSFGIIRNIYITDNDFKNIGGFGGVVSVVLLLGQTDLTTPSENIVISNNTIDLTGRRAETDGIFLYQIQEVRDATPANRITVSGNSVRNTRRPFKISGMKGVVFNNNTFQLSSHAGLVASTMPISSKDKEKCQYIEFRDNTFSDLGSADGVGIAVLNDVYHLTFIGNTFDNIGFPHGTSGKAISFQNGATAWVRIENNHFSGSRTRMAISMEPLAKTDLYHNSIVNNTFAEDQQIHFPTPQAN